ncbi:hypothetical protein HPB48_006205 [Haemaphysalis longicornis]|uniref:Uncharacterized protein n=1 Tax=Haemaphysalis longicornis TaxID=44386 RepID=A0A9J6FU43_HAELO|nr:hypothetical protein HPB48_006205 [Haemaphysalis longicornis]
MRVVQLQGYKQRVLEVTDPETQRTLEMRHRLEEDDLYRQFAKKRAEERDPYRAPNSAFITEIQNALEAVHAKSAYLLFFLFCLRGKKRHQENAFTGLEEWEKELERLTYRYQQEMRRKKQRLISTEEERLLTVRPSEGEGGPGEEHDHQAGPQEGVAHAQAARAGARRHG